MKIPNPAGFISSTYLCAVEIVSLNMPHIAVYMYFASEIQILIYEWYNQSVALKGFSLTIEKSLKVTRNEHLLFMMGIIMPR